MSEKKEEIKETLPENSGDSVPEKSEPAEKAEDIKEEKTGETASETDKPEEESGQTPEKTADKADKKKTGKEKRVLLTVLGVFVVLLIVVGVIVMLNGKKNIKAMNKAADKAIEVIGEHYNLKELDCSEYDGLKVMGIMKFKTEQYEAENLGNLCVMRANGGVMQMLTVILTPVKKDMPLLSIDYMYILGKRTAYVEIYDLSLDSSDVYKEAITRLQAVADKYTELNDTVPSSAWYDSIRPAGSYKKVKSKNDDDIYNMMVSYLETYLESADKMELLPEEKIPRKAEVMEGYSHRLITEGGISTDTFKKELGEEKTQELFDKVMFGTGNYKK